MNLQKWGKALLHRTTLRNDFLLAPGTPYVDEIGRDLDRTFPKCKWFLPHRPQLLELLNTYAYVNSGMGYCQGMNFVLFVLYKKFYVDSVKDARIRTYYAFHRLINVIRPVYPLNSKDTRPLQFSSKIASFVCILVSKHSIKLKRPLKHIVCIIINQTLPALFLNKYNVEDATLILDYIINKDDKVMFRKILSILVAIVLRFESVFVHLDECQILQIINIREYYEVNKILSISKRIYNSLSLQ